MVLIYTQTTQEHTCNDKLFFDSFNKVNSGAVLNFTHPHELSVTVTVMVMVNLLDN